MNAEIRALLNDPNSKYSNPWYRADDESILEIYDIDVEDIITASLGDEDDDWVGEEEV